MRIFGHRMIRLVALLVALSSTISLAQTGAKKSSGRPAAKKESGPPAILFIVSQSPTDAFIDPVVVINQRQFSEPPESGGDDFPKFQSRYYSDGQKYRLLFGGGEAGTVTVKKTGERGECLGSQAAVEIQMTAQAQSKIGGLVMGLATGAASLGNKTISRRFPTADEKALVAEMAGQFYRRKGISASSIQNMKQINMTAMDLNRDGRAEIIAAFSVTSKAKVEARHFLFLIAEPQARGYKAGLARYERLTEKDLPGGGTLEDVDEYALTEVLVDQLDIDRDGFAEIITAKKSWEGIGYRIYKKRKAQWAIAYEVYNYRCAY